MRYLCKLTRYRHIRNNAIPHTRARMNSQTGDYGQALTDKMVPEHSGVDMQNPLSTAQMR